MKKLTDRKFGIEIEMLVPQQYTGRNVADILMSEGVPCIYAGYTHEVLNNCWKVVTDCSIKPEESIKTVNFKGYELVSPPLSGKDGVNQLKAVCAVLDTIGATVNKSCGLHIHHEIVDYTLDSWKTLTKAYLKFEDEIDNFMPVSRKGNANLYCLNFSDVNSLSGMNLKSKFDLIDSKSTVSDLLEVFTDTYRARYRKLNVTSYAVYGTIEFRHHSGTVEFEKIVNWLLLTQGLVERGARAKKVVAKRPNQDKWFESLMYTAEVEASVVKFYTGRKALLAS